MEKWDYPEIDFNTVDKEYLKCCFEMAEKRLKSTLEVSALATTRAFQTLTAIVPAITLAVASILTKALDHKVHEVIVPAAIGIFFGMLAFIRLYRVIETRDMHQIGREPSALLKLEYYASKDYANDASYKLLLTLMMVDYQERIDFMDTQNEERVKDVQHALDYIKYAFMTIVLYAIFWAILAY